MIAQFGTQCLTKYSVEDAAGLIYSDSEYENINERKVGILPNTSLSSTLINTVLRQSTFAGIILQNTIKAVVQKADSTWAKDDRIEKALSCDKTSTDTGYTYSDLIAKFIEQLQLIQQIQNSSALTIQKATTADNYYTGSSLYTLLKTTLPNNITSFKNSISTKKQELNTKVVTLQDNIQDSTNNIPVYYALDYNTKYSGTNSIYKKFEAITEQISTLERNTINGN